MSCAYLSLSAELVISQVDNHVKKGLTSKLINGISRLLRKLRKYFNGTIILTFGYHLLKLSFGSSLQYCHKHPDFFK